MNNLKNVNYGAAIRHGFHYLLETDPKVFTIGQGLWSPWYVGNSMTDLEKEFGKERVLDTPVSEHACTGAAIGASLCGYRPVVIHPRVDFMLLAVDQIVNQAAKWGHMLGGQTRPAVTIRGIINRGGEQGAQHSQSLHSWFAHIPGLRVVMPASVQDARDLLIASVLCDDPVVYLDDRWLYDLEADLPPAKDVKLSEQGPRVVNSGTDITLVAASYSVELCRQAAKLLEKQGVTAEVIDLRVLNPYESNEIIKSVSKTGRLLAVDGDWRVCGYAGEVIASAVENIDKKIVARRITLPDAPAPTSRVLEEIYYPTVSNVVNMAISMMEY